MAYIKERGNNNYFVRASYGIMENGRPFQKSRLFRPSKVNLPESKVRKELDAFVKALEEECRIEFELKHQHKPNVDFDENETAQELAEVAVTQESQHALAPIQTSSTPLFSDFCRIYLTAKKENISSTTYLLYDTAIQRILIPKLGHLHLDDIYVEMHESQKRIYEFIEEKFVKDLADSRDYQFKKSLVKARLIRLMQAATNPELLTIPLSVFANEEGISLSEVSEDAEIIKKVMEYLLTGSSKFLI